MDHHPPHDRRISGGTVAAAWALVASLAAVTMVASAFAPMRPHAHPVTEQAALHAGACAPDQATDDGPDPSLRD